MNKKEENYLNSNGGLAIKDLYLIFEIIRDYRNNADHPNTYRFTQELCIAQMQTFNRYFAKLIVFTKSL